MVGVHHADQAVGAVAAPALTAAGVALQDVATACRQSVVQSAADAIGVPIQGEACRTGTFQASLVQRPARDPPSVPFARALAAN